MQDTRKRIIILGATGSIGLNAVDVIQSHAERYRVVGLSANDKAQELAELAATLGTDNTCLSGATASPDSATFTGPEGLLRLIKSTDADIVLNAIAGRAGLESSFAALESGKHLALANKESMVCAGPLLRKCAATADKHILPVDSEHSAVFHLIQALGADKIAQVILTASGGPFRDLPAGKFPEIKLEDALKHPNWSMGKKITIDSASMANKGLEVIEAYELFGLDPRRIKVLIHRESKVHSLVRSVDGSLYAQISKPDMRVPIHNAFSYPELIPCPFGALDLAGERLSFDAPDFDRFPLLALAYRSLEKGGMYPLAYNAANEVAVDLFLKSQLSFMGISRLVEAALQHDWGKKAEALGHIIETDTQVRDITLTEWKKGF